MQCERWHEVISARMDGEASPIEVEALLAHLEDCTSCRSYQGRARQLARLTRVTLAEPIPDLSARILARLAPTPAPNRFRQWLRAALAAVGVVQLALALPGLGGHLAGAHIVHELSAWNLGLGLGFLLVAWQPVRALGLLPVVACVSFVLVLTAGEDLLTGAAHMHAESKHFVALVGLVLLWLVGRGVRGYRQVRG